MITLGGGLLTFAPFFLTHFAFKNKPWVERFKRIYARCAGGTGLALFFALLFFCPIAMTTTFLRAGQMNPDVGNLLLVGVPYGENKAGNFFAYFSIVLFLPSVALALFQSLLPSRRGKFINGCIALPNLALIALTCPNLHYGFLGELGLGYKSILLSLTLGVSFGLSLFLAVDQWRESYKPSRRDILFGLGYFLMAALAFLPIASGGILIPTDFQILGQVQNSWRAVDFSFIHRLYLYVGIVYYVFLYFLLRNDEENARRAMLLAVSFGAISAFFGRYGFEGIFPPDSNYQLLVTRLPIHLCHTALFIVPLCIGFKWKRLFYFTYFINVYGALMAMLWPNNGDVQNFLDPDVLLFWYNHWAALFMPLIAVTLGIFPRPKMKEMGYSLLFFSIYFVAMMAANGFLSPLVPGYNPNVPGTGTDYLFLNNDYILGILGNEAKKMLNIKLQFEAGGNIITFYPLYQGLFFVGYVLIAFLMWFVYSLFFRIEDAHLETHARYKIARAHHLTWKEQQKMKDLAKEPQTAEPRIDFVHFSKRYLSSAKLSADDVNLSVKGGEIFGFLGPNGAGKSTCIKTAIGIQPVTSGSISICGYDITEQPVEAKMRIGYVPDHYALYEKLTGREYINYVADLYHVSKEDRDRRIAHYVELFELTGAFDAKMQTYSHGMKQKMAIIAALVHDPKIWILDEPLTGLDPQSIFQVKQTMVAHAKAGNVVFFSSHIIDVVERLCTRIAVIRQGKIVYEGSMEEVQKNHPEGLEKFYMSLIGEDVGGE